MLNFLEIFKNNSFFTLKYFLLLIFLFVLSHSILPDFWGHSVSLYNCLFFYSLKRKINSFLLFNLLLFCFFLDFFLFLPLGQTAFLTFLSYLLAERVDRLLLGDSFLKEMISFLSFNLILTFLGIFLCSESALSDLSFRSIFFEGIIETLTYPGVVFVASSFLFKDISVQYG